MLPLSLGREDCCPNFLPPPYPCFYFGKLRISPGHLLPKANDSGEPHSPPRLCPHFFFFLSFRQGFIIHPWLALELTKILLPVSQVLVLKTTHIQLISWSPLVPSPPSFFSLEPVSRLCLEFRVLGLKARSSPKSQSKFLLVPTLVFDCPKGWTICLISNKAFHLKMLSTSSLKLTEMELPFIHQVHLLLFYDKCIKVTAVGSPE